MAALFAVIRDRKHGDHDQSEHGNWATMTPKERDQAALEHQSDLSWDKRTYTHLSPHPLTNLQENVLINWVETAGAHRNISNMFRQWGPDPSKWVDNIRASGAAPTSREEESAFAAQQMASAFATSPGLSQDVTLYRGWANAPDFEVGQEFVSEGFTSTSSDQAVAGAFGGGGTVFHMKVPAGTRAIDLGETMNPGEFEILLDANTKWRVASVETVDSVPVDRHIDNTQGMPDKETKIVTLELVPQEPVSKSVKHEAGPDHDQDDHGNWARVQRDETERAKNDPWANSVISRSDAYATLNDYTGNGAIHINRLLRNGEAAESGARSKANLEQDIDAIDALFFRAPRLTVPETVYRGISSRVGGEVFADVQPGFVFTDPGYTSTSLSSAVAQNFTGYGQQKKYVMEITLPQGSQVVEVEASNEKEILLNRGSSFRVDNVETQGDTKVIMATLLEGLESTKSLKHGDHDQSDHGNWATGGGFSAPSQEDIARTRADYPRAVTTAPTAAQGDAWLERRDTFSDYTSGTTMDGEPLHAALNEELRNGRTLVQAANTVYADMDDDANAASRWQDVDRLIRSNYILEETTLYRGSSPIVDRVDLTPGASSINLYGMTIEPGAIISDAGYVSTSRNQGSHMTYFQENWGDLSGLDNDQAPASVQWRIKAPAGAPALELAVAGHQGNYSEGEVLLPRNTHLRVDNVDISTMGGDRDLTGIIKIDATIVPTHETSKSVKHEAGPDHDQDDHGNWARGLMTPEVKGRISAAVQELDDYTPDGQDRQDRIERVMEEYVDTLSPANREAEAAEIVDKAQAEFIERRTAAITRAIPEIVKNVSDFREAGGFLDSLDVSGQETTYLDELETAREKLEALKEEADALEPSFNKNIIERAIFEEQARPAETELLIARDDQGRLAGVMALEGNYVTYLGSTGSLPGTGSALMYEAMTLARGAGDAGLSLESVPDAQNFYEEKLGLANINDEMNQEGYYGDQWGFSGTHKLSPGELNLVVDYVKEMLPKATSKSVKHADHDQSEHGNWASGVAKEWASDPRLRTGSEAWEKFKTLDQVPPYEIGTEHEAAEPQVALRLAKNLQQFKDAGGTIKAIPKLPNAGVSGAFTYDETEEQKQLSEWLAKEQEIAKEAEWEYALRAGNGETEEERRLFSVSDGYMHMATALERPSVGTFVAMQGDRVVGVLNGGFNNNEYNATMLGTSQDVPGTGSALIEAAMRAMHDRGLRQMTVEMPEEQSLGFYKALGMVPDHGTRDWVGVPSPSSVAISTGSVSRILDAVDGRTPPEIVSDYKPAKSIKHGDHDQDDHGNWAHGNALDKFVKPVRVQSYESTREKQWDDGAFTQFASEQDLENANLTKAQAAAVLEYAQNEYAELNGLLRGHDMGVSTVSQELHAARMTVLDEAIAANSLEEDTTLYRGAGLTRQTHERLLSTLEVGGVYTDPAFGSTTTDRSIAGGFASGLIAGETYGIDYQVRWEINAPEGSAALSVTDLVPKSREAEVLLPRNSHYRVDSVRTEPMPGGAVGIGRTTVKLTLLPTESTKSIKHEAGPDHDQLDHGNWATGARASAYDPAVDKPPADNLYHNQFFSAESASTWRGVDTDEAREALGEYQSGMSYDGGDPAKDMIDTHRAWNQALRAGTPIEKLPSDARQFAELVESNVLRNDTTLYRGTAIGVTDPAQTKALGDAIHAAQQSGGMLDSITLPGFGEIKPGAVFAEGGFMSTTKSEYTASQFAQMRFNQQDTPFTASVIWDIKAPAGTSALDITMGGGRPELFVDIYDRDTGEQEVVLGPNTHLEVTGLEVNDIGDIVISANVAKATTKSIKHADHDQSEHGNWATGNFAQGTSKGGNGLRVIDAIRQQSRYDNLVKKVYAGQEKAFPLQLEGNPSPVAPKRANFGTQEEYEKAFKEYDKAYDAFALRAYTHVASDTGREFLDGSIGGVRGYVTAVVESDWFQEAFGDGASIGGIPPIKTTTSNESGSFRMKANASGTLEETRFQFNKAALMNEPTLLHEIAHFATAISATETHEAHGVEFAKNFVYIADKVAGSEFATTLKEALVKEGVPLED